MVHGGDIAHWEVFEASYECVKTYLNAFMDVEVDVDFKQGE